MGLHSKGRKHNKKRNAGLIYEFLIRHIIDGCLRENSHVADQAMSIIKRRFKPGTELYKEWRLMNALVKTASAEETVANAIIRETRDAVRRYDRVKLDKEKSLLIREINHTFGKKFYNRGVRDYKLYATVQTLFDDWRTTGVPNISRIADYEKSLHEHLMRESDEKLQSAPDPAADALVVKLMTKKLNERYAGRLNAEQRSILGRYTFEGPSSDLIKSLDDLKETTLTALDAYMKVILEGKDKFTTKKLKEARREISRLSTEDLNDTAVARFMKLSELKEELSDK